ncbi:MAG: outer membrane protein assembly factor BamB [Betaproteobacteria bacterium]|nr:outer membrane protein assembly factor BamB [Betaproteobacteria bacterium]NBY34049.1 outer membrane protein assembly factor BamB [Betaproteobacteria bacterium]NDF06594.1 outer membrane protein assembly factor BamB [Betaproteobacteria bacterium]
MKAVAISRWALLVFLGIVLSACGVSKPKPAQIPAIKADKPIQALWQFKLGSDVSFVQSLQTVQERMVLTSDDGKIAVVNVRNGQAVWRHELKTALNTGAGFDGEHVAVVTLNNELVLLQDGKVLWRNRLTSQSYTHPLVAGERVFMMMADRSVLAFDLATGVRLWVQQRPGEPLVLKQNGVLMAFQNTLLVGLGGRLTAINPDNGQFKWDVPIANPRGINDLERLVDLVAKPTRIANSVCVRAFQSQVGCVDALRGSVLWTRSSVGSQGLDGDAKTLIGTESNGMVQAWSRTTGDRVWDTDRLKYRELTGPLFTSKGVVIGDSGGWLYLLSSVDGSLINRVQTSSDGFASTPTALADGGFVVLTRDGFLQAYQLP